MDRTTPNLPSADLDWTAAFYANLGFSIGFKDDGWMILNRGPLELEFYPLQTTPKTYGSACVRVDDLDGLREGLAPAGELTEFCRDTPGMLPIQEAHGIRMFLLIDPDGNLLRCIDNRYRG